MPRNFDCLAHALVFPAVQEFLPEVDCCFGPRSVLRLDVEDLSWSVVSSSVGSLSMNKAVVSMCVARWPLEGSPACFQIPCSTCLEHISVSKKPAHSPDLSSHFLCCRSVLFRLCFSCRLSQCFVRLQHVLQDLILSWIA